MSSLSDDTTCRLCSGRTAFFWKTTASGGKAEETFFTKCQDCQSVARSASSFLSHEQEKTRYLNHQNDINNKGYQDFVSPITNAVLSAFKPEQHEGLDYGCGTGPVISHILNANGFEMALYDPFFYPDESYLYKRYDFIACCEVMEHFYAPKAEFEKLRKLLKNGGKLYCKTALISNELTAEQFSNWYYKNDPTHVFFYSPKGLTYIKEANGFSDLSISEKLITFIV